MVLSRPDLLEYLETGRLRIDPRPDPDSIAQVSIDLRLGRKFTSPRPLPPHIPLIRIDPTLWQDETLWRATESDSFVLHPGEIVLAHTLERVQIPNDLVGLVEGRSSFARAGVTIHVTAPKIDPGFDGTITLEMVNFGKFPVELRASVMKPAQLMLVTLSQPIPPDETYGSHPGDVFQNQDAPLPKRAGS